MLQSEYNNPWHTCASIEQRFNVILLSDLQLAAHSYAFVCGTNNCLSASDKFLKSRYVSV